MQIDLLLYSIACLSALGGVLLWKQTAQCGGLANAYCLLYVATFSGAYAFLCDYSTASETTAAVTFLGGAILGLSTLACFLLRCETRKIAEQIKLLLMSMLLLLGVAALYERRPSRMLDYHGVLRWCGPWDNPNDYGLLMGLGSVLAICLAVWMLKFRNTKGDAALWRCSISIVFVSAAGITGRGVVKSYSRGAVVAAACASAYLMLRVYASTSQACWRRRSAVALTIIVMAFMVVGAWELGTVGQTAARRLHSMVNVNDFSWRNRVAAWEGGLQIMAERPWLGFGWNQPERYYGNYFMVRRVEQGAAFQMNDYFNIGTTLGIPALVCFCTYVWLSLRRTSEFGVRNAELGKTETQELDGTHGVTRPTFEVEKQLAWLRTTCRAGAIVFLVGFWFDGGLFKMATAGPFWILIELGRED